MLEAKDVAAIRVGVTGARAFDESGKTSTTSHINLVLARAKAAVELNAIRDEYILRIISPLAEGADRYVAEIALSLGYELEVVTPFPRQEYEADFISPVDSSKTSAFCINEFRSLLEKSSGILELDGNRSAVAGSYEAAGRVVVRNSDLVIAVWNGKEGAGRGGTADIIRFAVEQGVPVWWVPTDGSLPGWITSLQHTTTPTSAPSGSYALEYLERYLIDLLQENSEPEKHAHGIFNKISHPIFHANHTADRNKQPLRRPWFRVYSIFEKILTHRAPKAQYPAAVLSNENEWKFWQSKSENASRDAEIYMAGYRSSYVIVLVLAALALITAVASLAWPSAKLILSILEFLILIGIGWIILLAQKESWHSQAIRRRLSAELCRTQAFLSLFGDGIRIPASAATQKEIRRFLSLRRGRFLTKGYLSCNRLSKIKVLIRSELLESQLIYHRNRRNRMLMASRKLALLGEWIFILIVVLVAIKIIMMLVGIGYILISTIGILTAALPAVAAFSVGVRSYAEFDLIAEQSNRMEAVMSIALQRLDKIDIEAANASQRMADVVRDTADEMLQELQGWSAVAHSKILEAG
jgi:hypothetical protein